MSKKYTHLLFDWDGTLVNTLTVWLTFYKTLLSELTINTMTNKDIVRTLFGNPEPYNALHVTQEMYEEADKKALTKFNLQEKLQTASFYPHVVETLKRLNKKDISLSIVTSSNKQKYVLPILQRNNLKSIFDSIIGKNEVEMEKPNPEGILLTLEKLKANPTQALMVGDSPKDILAGKKAGIDTVLFYPKVNRTMYEEDELRSHNPTFFTTDFKHMLSFV